jgi:alkaline phosphatase
MSAEDVLETYAGVDDLTQAEKDAIEAYGEMGISDALSDRAGVVWGAPGIPARAPDDGKHSDFEIPVWAYGPGTGGLEGNIQNTDIGNKIFDLVD